MKMCGVCGTDIEKVRGDAVTPPVLGHEVVGEISAIGAGTEGHRKGERVFAHHHAPCYTCEACMRGEYTLCPEFPLHNLKPGGFSEFYIVPKWNVRKGAVLRLPDTVSDEDGTFIEPLGCCIRGLAKVGAEGLASAVIYGAGPVGLLHLLLLRNMSYRRIAVADPSRYRLDFAAKSGATRTFDPGDEAAKASAFGIFDETGPELAIVATASIRAVADALRSVAPGGKVLLFGAPAKGASLDLNLSDYFLKSATLVSSYSTSEKETGIALGMLEAKRLRVSRLVTHKFSLDQAAEAFRAAEEQRCIKALVAG